MNRKTERLLIAGLLLLSAAFAAKAQKAPRALQISAENLNAHAPRHADSSRVLPGDTLRYHLLFTNVSAGAVHGKDLATGIKRGHVVEALNGQEIIAVGKQPAQRWRRRLRRSRFGVIE